VKRLLSVWTDKQRIDTIYLKEANLKLEEAESAVTAQEEAAARSRAQAAAAAARAAARRAPRIIGCYMPAPARRVREADILPPAPPLATHQKQEGGGAGRKKEADMGLEEEASLASLMEEAEEMEAAQLAALQEEQAARDAKPRWANLFGPEAVGRPAKAWEYDLFGRHDHPCQGLLAPAGLVLGFTGLLLEEALPWEVASRGGEPLELKGTWKHVSVWGACCSVYTPGSIMRAGGRMWIAYSLRGQLLAVAWVATVLALLMHPLAATGCCSPLEHSHTCCCCCC
jgi:hypothetical protein